MQTSRSLVVSLVCTVALGAITNAAAQVYPTRPITMLVPFPAGGPTDTIGRVVAERMRGSLGQPIVIENVGGASGSIGVGRLARAAGDGYTFGIGNWGTFVLNGAVLGLPYDITKDFEPLSLLVTNPLLIAAKTTMPAGDLEELVAWLKANPDQASLGAGGAAGLSTVVGVLLQRETGTRFKLVPYRGLGPAMQDLIAGQLDLMIDGATTLLPQVRARSIKAYAVTANSRLAMAPEIPTVDEAGLPGFHISSWHALWMTTGAPSAVVARLHAAVVDALAYPTVRSRLTHIGQVTFPDDPQTPEALSALQKAEIDKWWPIIKAANIKAE